MRKKLTVLLVLLCIVSSLSFASDWQYVFGEEERHPEIFGGALPSYVSMGTSYEGFSLFNDNLSSLQILGGLGVTQRKLWQNPADGSVLSDNPLVYDVFHTDFMLKLFQVLLYSEETDKDCITAYAGVKENVEIYMDSMVEGEDRQNGSTTYTVQSISDWFGSTSITSNTYYPELGGNGSFMIGTTLYAGIKFDQMIDRMVTQDGMYSDLSLEVGPSFLNSLFSGTASFYSLTSNTVVAKTLYQVKAEDKKNLFSLVLIDRVNFNWTDGDAVPTYAQYSVSLGNKVRGYTAWTYNTQFTAVNNLELRISGPESIRQGLFPRINIFCDIGFGAGNYFNTSTSATNFLASAGIQGTFSIFDNLDLGYQLAYLFTGDNYVYYGTSITGEITFTLDF
jgi:hypothetical protein